MQLQYLDGKRLRAAVNAGWSWLNRNRERLNAINVFPVADGDTGTNMALTLRYAAIGANSVKSNKLYEVAEAMALHSLRGARGNSGVILSQYFRGFSEYIGNRRRLKMNEIAGAFAAGAESAYRALQDPREGTILTVIREIAEHMQSVHDKCENLAILFESAIEKGKKSVEATKYKLKVLSDAKVVDAGGQGFLHFIEGIGRLIKNGRIELESDTKGDSLELPVSLIEVSRYRYCSEFLVHSPNFDIDQIKQDLEGFGDSLIVASMKSSGQTLLRIHIHTDNPHKIEEYSASIGVLENKKIDDMQQQNQAMINRQRSKIISQRAIHIVTDSTCDLPQELQEKYGIEVVPLKVSFGDETFLDGQTLSAGDFYQKMQNLTDYPKTSQPSPGDFINAYESILEKSKDSQILSLHLSSKLSGTFNSASQAAAGFGKNITIYDTDSVSFGLGIMAIAAAEMADRGETISRIIKKLDRMKKNQLIVFTLGTLDYVIRGGRIGKAKGFVAKLFGLKPILAIQNGLVVPIAKASNEEKLLAKIKSLLPKSTPDTKWAIAHANAPEKIPSLKKMLAEEFGAENILDGEFGPTVGSHAGPGTWGIICVRG